jgi:hypothetical protein
LINIGALYFIFRVFSKKYVYYSDDNTFQMSLLSNQYWWFTFWYSIWVFIVDKLFLWF